MSTPWVSFCMSTYKRPDFLKQQLKLLLTQTDSDFNIIVSDNDATDEARIVAESFNDPRIKYYKNETNLGMVQSFNKSIERATTPYIVMVTDDDPVYPEMLSTFRKLIEQNPGYAIYCGAIRPQKKEKEIECFTAEDFTFQLLHPKLTQSFLWSSTVLDRSEALLIGGMPDYGSPHLADHAMLALCSKNSGGLFYNKMFSHLNKHDTNFSKSNFELYYIAAREFSSLITNSFPKNYYEKQSGNALKAHLKEWFITNIFVLKRYFSISNPNQEKEKAVNQLTADLLLIPLFKEFQFAYYKKLITFAIKRPFRKMGVLK